MNTVAFLQNAWSPLYAGGTWPRRSWLKALARSRSGQRLRIMLDDLDVCQNTTPIVGGTPDSVIEPDERHIIRVLASEKPELVIACGRQAEEALTRLWPGALLAVPHPAHRLLTDDLYRQARELIPGMRHRTALRQGRGVVNWVDLPFAQLLIGGAA